MSTKTEFFQRVYPSIQTLARHGTQFYLCYVKPAPMLRCIMDFQINLYALTLAPPEQLLIKYIRESLGPNGIFLRHGEGSRGRITGGAMGKVRA
jgi:hypothetical protein